jgi:vanillate O-demethylase monooxygenase subunit
MFIRNRWYAAAWDHEISGKPFARKICGEPIVFYRKSDRGIAALEDVCPHRLAPLSKGKISNDCITCGYHGITYDAMGKAVSLPGGGSVERWVNVKSYPVVESHRFIWVWIGDPQLASKTDLPNLWFCSDPAWAFDGGHYHVKCDYRLILDNLLDLTHETYVHPTTIGQAEIEDAPIEARQDDNSVTVSRWMHGIDPPPVWKSRISYEGKSDRWQISRFTPPSQILIEVGVAPVGQVKSEDDIRGKHGGVGGVVVNLITPETDTTSWYFWGHARNYNVADSGFTIRNRDVQGRIFLEDLDMLEAQQINMKDFPDRYLANLKFDAGSRLARRMIENELERAGRATTLANK